MASGGDDPTKMRARPACGWRLLLFWEGGSGVHELAGDTDVVIGRADDCDVRLPHESVSRRHGVLRRDGSAWRIEDLGSSNGTRVGGRSVKPRQRVPLPVDSLVVLGTLQLVVRRARAGDAAPRSAPERSMRAVWRLVDLVAPSDLSVLVLGETGVGKEVVARAIHERSRRAARPLLVLNCAAIPEQTLESELFGHERGAFTGAVAAKPGLLEAADGGTVLLDEIGEMPIALQAKLLRALDAGEIVRLGSVRPRTIDVRILAATHRDPPAMVEEGTFRADLLYRLDGMTIHVPPLRDRKGEIAALARRFLRDAAAKAGRPEPSLSADAIERLEAHSWPGNVRELRKVVERAFVLSGGGSIDAEHVVVRSPKGRTSEPAAAATGATLGDERERAEIRAIREALEACNGNQTKAAAMLGVSRRTLIERLDRYDLPRPRKA